jgi:pimeloyl-ACP methyl ester carboxylesterase
VADLWKRPLTPRLPEIICPALVVAGGEDTVTRGPGGSVLMSRSLPDSRLEIFQDAGHGIYREKAEEFRTLAVEFCREHGIIGD